MEKKVFGQRLLALDVLRGITIVGMILVNNPGSYGRFSELFDGALAVESVQDKHWVKLDEGYHELVVEIPATVTLHEMFIRMFHDNNRRILPPRKICLYASTNGVEYDLLSVKDVVRFANSKHDSWIEGVWFGNMDSSVRFLKIAFYADEKVYIDEWYVNPEYKI